MHFACFYIDLAYSQKWVGPPNCAVHIPGILMVFDTNKWFTLGLGMLIQPWNEQGLLKDRNMRGNTA